MEKVWGCSDHVGPDVLIWAGERNSPGFRVPRTAELRSAGQVRTSFGFAQDRLCPTRSVPLYAVFFSTSAEFFDPNPTQLQIACSIWALRPTSGT